MVAGGKQAILGNNSKDEDMTRKVGGFLEWKPPRFENFHDYG
jgi:hypothetical protein